jgi:hypothetical protein
VGWKEEAYRIHGSLQSTAKDIRKYSTHAKSRKGGRTVGWAKFVTSRVSRLLMREATAAAVADKKVNEKLNI